jgi:hypothetical protein
MPIATYDVYLEHPPESLKKFAHVIDRRCGIKPGERWALLGHFQNPTMDLFDPVYHKVRDILARFEIYDMANVALQLTRFERVYAYELPYELSVELGSSLMVPYTRIPATSTSVPHFEAEDESILAVNNQGLVTPRKKGVTRLIVTAPDNPILRYEIQVTVTAKKKALAK